eukprot:g18486.t1
MKGMIDDMAGVNGQLQAEVGDLRGNRSGGGAMDESDDVIELEMVVADMPPPPPRVASSLSTPLMQFRTKAIARDGENETNAWRWYISGVQPVAAGLTLQRSKLLLHDTAEITSTNLGMIIDIADIDTREFVSPGDDRFATDRMPTEHLQIFIDFVIKVVSKGVTSDSKARISTLERGLRSGLALLRRHCIECRNEVRIPANSKMLVNLANKGLRDGQRECSTTRPISSPGTTCHRSSGFSPRSSYQGGPGYPSTSVLVGFAIRSINLGPTLLRTGVGGAILGRYSTAGNGLKELVPAALAVASGYMLTIRIATGATAAAIANGAIVAPATATAGPTGAVVARGFRAVVAAAAAAAAATMAVAVEDATAAAVMEAVSLATRDTGLVVRQGKH